MAEDPKESLHNVIVFHPRDWGKDKGDAWIYGIVIGWDAASLAELEVRHGWKPEDIARLSRLHSAFIHLEKPV